MHSTSRRLFSLLTLIFAVCSGVVAHAQAGSTNGAPQVLLSTTLGDIVIELMPQKSPKSVKNFLDYVKNGHYNGTVFHRVIDGFMIQGGGFDENMQQKPTQPPVVNEAKNGVKNTMYSVSMARTSNPDSATSQFFINVADNAGLDYPQPDGAGYTVFGKVVKGTEVVDRIKGVATGSKGMNQNVPLKPITIQSAKILP
jgi:peptidyl-prolyl cis-trans isomerase A (cyclophilin A)